MLSYNYVIDANVYLFTYMFIYNVALTTLFWTLFNIIITQFKTLQMLNGFSFNSFYVLILTILLFSIAGVPPFIGFFSKLFIIVSLINNYFFLLYSIFFITLFVGLYFYMQNIRFLYSTNYNTLNYPFLLNERHSISYYYYSIFIIIIFCLGTFYIDDFILIISWLLS